MNFAAFRLAEIRQSVKRRIGDLLAVSECLCAPVVNMEENSRLAAYGSRIDARHAFEHIDVVAVDAVALVVPSVVAAVARH